MRIDQRIKDAESTALGVLDYQTVIDCSTNPNYPAATKGWMYIVSVAGKIGGGSGLDVKVGGLLICKTTAAAGTQAGVGGSWDYVPTVAPNASITTAMIVDNAITTAKINAGAVANSQLAPDAVDEDVIQDGAIATAKIPDGAVTNAKTVGASGTFANVTTVNGLVVSGT